MKFEYIFHINFLFFTFLKIEFLPYETLYNILIPLFYPDIITFCRTNRQYANICQDPNFW